MMTDKMKVIVRIRPDPNLNNEPVLKVASGNEINFSVDGKALDYKFDRVHGECEETLQIFSESVAPIIKKVLKGYNGCIIVYGPTGTGKTMTMEGKVKGDGLMSMAIQLLLKAPIEVGKVKAVKLSLSAIELYLGKLKDLFDLDNKKVKIREHADTGVFIEGATEKLIADDEEFAVILAQLKASKMMASTMANPQSSQSHVIYLFAVVVQLEGGESCRSSFALADLAGSERLIQSGVSGVQKQEMVKNNSSLLTLGTVINARAEKQFVPYRDSDLTWVLKPFLDKNSVTLLMGFVAQGKESLGFTQNTLNFVKRAMKVQMHPKLNVTPNAELPIHPQVAEQQPVHETDQYLELLNRFEAQQVHSENLQQQLAEMEILMRTKDPESTGLVSDSDEEEKKDEPCFLRTLDPKPETSNKSMNHSEPGPSMVSVASGGLLTINAGVVNVKIDNNPKQIHCSAHGTGHSKYDCSMITKEDISYIQQSVARNKTQLVSFAKDHVRLEMPHERKQKSAKQFYAYHVPTNSKGLIRVCPDFFSILMGVNKRTMQKYLAAKSQAACPQ